MVGYVIAMLICLYGWYQWFYFSKRLGEEQARRAMIVQVLSRLYGGQFVSGCNWRYDHPPCNDSTPLDELCAPCFGRRTLEHEEKGSR